MSRDPLLHSLIRNTLAPVIINGGFRANVIPGSAQATINLRTIPGTNTAKLLDELRRVIADSTIELKGPSSTASATRPSVSTEDTDLYRALERAAHATFPGAEVTPYLFQAGTDAGAWRSKGYSGVRHLSISDRRRRVDADARKRREGQRRVVEAGDGDDLPNVGGRGGQALAGC